MLLGEFLYTSATPVYTPATPRTSQKMVFNFDINQLDGTGKSLAIDFEHKNVVDNTWSSYTGGTWSPSGSPFNATGTYSYVVDSPLELIRVKFTLSGTAAIARVFVFPQQNAAPM